MLAVFPARAKAASPALRCAADDDLTKSLDKGVTGCDGIRSLNTSRNDCTSTCGCWTTTGAKLCV